ncbi:MAG TPA: hypothetical protein VJ870_18870 [Amycolatopsis sp.]|nr:hypothetical protein [Amycolatopsis sp.]
MRVNLLRTGGLVGVTAAALVIAAASPAGAATAGPGEGSAYGASATVNLLPGVTGQLGLGTKGITVDTGKLAPSNTGGPTSATVVDVPLKGLVTAKAITSFAKHDTTSGDVNAEAEILGVKLPVLKPVTDSTPSVDVIKSTCMSTANGVTGGSVITNLDLGKFGTFTIPPDKSANQVLVNVPNVVKVTANEQVKHSDGSLTVNALHVQLLGGDLAKLGSGDIILASSTCGPATAGNGGATTPTTGTTPAPAGNQVSVVPAGAPQTGDGSLAAVVVGG